MSTLKRETHEIRLDQHGDVDELCIPSCQVHLERMNDAEWWMGLTLPNGERIDLRFGAVNQKAKFYLHVDEDFEDGYQRFSATNPRGVSL